LTFTTGKLENLRVREPATAVEWWIRTTQPLLGTNQKYPQSSPLTDVSGLSQAGGTRSYGMVVYQAK
jgi:hypothetical protein